MGEGKRNSSLIAWSSAWDMLLVPSLNGLMSIPTRNGLTMRSNGLVSSSDSENGARDRQGSKTGPCRGLTPTRLVPSIFLRPHPDQARRHTARVPRGGASSQGA
jgi:hypothetical protein